ncbi:MAG: 4-hydroxy-3-methylbut-2-enyl diphosphate reductase [Lachnospiraceae bacterium]|nr:4-hydroxy-3-methylbut-2-enyl diphosphate reductase [Lachnospiraceae bacterium]MCI9657379.1 4-hydroxy-3-methylbut-2-enyl diphosphate reductase [Lachnospiraceae bacterium]
MQVKVAKSAGFCFGVQRAVDTVYEQVEKGMRPIYTYGPIIHNEVVVQDLEEKGVQVLNSQEELEGLTEGTVIIRSHGVGKEIYDLIQRKGLHCVDATCPFVKKIHRTVERESQAGKQIIIIGNDKHPEVEGIKGWCSTPAVVLESPEQAENFKMLKAVPLCVVSQTTFNYKKFQDLVEILDKKRYDRSVVNTICNATEERQAEARQIAGEVDAMIVIGGSHSSNTQKLFEICRNECKNTYYIQTVHDLNLGVLRSTGLIGITAGASTPKKIIEEVQTRCLN